MLHRPALPCIKLVSERRSIHVVARELALSYHMHELNASEHTAAAVE